jgi:hypothetical protein
VHSSENEFTYTEVVTALARVFGIRDGYLKAFRGRIIHFQRLGMAPSRPGKGKRIIYRREDVFRWAISFELAEFNIDPTIIRVIVDAFWHDIRPHLLSDALPDKYFFFHPFLLERDSPKDEQQGLRGVPLTSVLAKVIGDLSEIDRVAKNASGRFSAPRVKARYGMINLGHLRREVESALAAVLA